MARVRIYWPGEKLRRVQRRLDRSQAALKRIGVSMVAESQRAFKDQRFGTKTWQQRGLVNYFGLIADFTEGAKAPKKRRFDRRPALQDTGRLAGSIAFEVGADYVEVGTNVEYAAVHQGGGLVESKPLTDTVRKALWAWLKRQRKEMKALLGWMLNKKFRNQRLEAEVPARPFVGITQQTLTTIKRIVAEVIFESRG